MNLKTRSSRTALRPWLVGLFASIFVSLNGFAETTLGLWDSFVCESSHEEGMFPVVADHGASTLYYDDSDWTGVVRAISDLQLDIEKVSDLKPQLSDESPSEEYAIIIGTIGKSALIDGLVAASKIDGSLIEGKWESFVVATVESPMPGVKHALVIAGSDKRGTIYGIYELSKQIGVSPWYFWADAPIEHKKELFVTAGQYYSGEPKIKYRGIFLNDEAPCLRNWAKENYGGHNREFYAKVFELMLRNRANYLWPAMWLPTIFNVDDPGNAQLADEYGIVMSTSHHEPMMRSHQEWYDNGEGDWNYETNKAFLQQFWREGVERIGNYESVVTMGMRGDGDEAMSEGTAVDLLKTIISDQREILSDVVGKPAEAIPQVWALYKEVQDYYDKGMRVDDDILVLFSDDNWGNIRFVPKKEDLGHKGGYGMYYHFDYVGAPVSYRWMNVTQIERVWEQMNICYESGIHDLWIVNVGDIKPMEFPISFFMDFAWNPEAIGAEDLPEYYVNWSKQVFGDEYAEEIGEVLALYTKYNSRRTPEMITAETFSVGNYREADRIVAEFSELSEKANTIYDKLPESHKAAFYQLCLYPVDACKNLTEMYVAAGKNHYYAEKGYPIANEYAAQVKEFFRRDAELTTYFHEEMADGKWNHMMSQTHIGYTYWNQPPLNKMPAITYVQHDKPAELGFLIEYGAVPKWGWLDVEADWSFSEEMPLFDPINDQDYYIEVLNRGEKKLSYALTAKQDWIQLSVEKGKIRHSEKVYVTIDWDNAPLGQAIGEIVISGAGSEYVVRVPINNEPLKVNGFVENNGVIAIEAAHYDRVVNTDDVRWVEIPNLGRTDSSMTILPSNAESQIPGEGTPSLEYTFTTLSEAKIAVDTYVSPSLNFTQGEGFKLAISIDDEAPQVVNMHAGETVPDWKFPDWWSNAVSNRVKILRSEHNTVSAGQHTLKVWMIDPGVVVQKFVIDAGGLNPSYLGPQESLRVE